MILLNFVQLLSSFRYYYKKETRVTVSAGVDISQTFYCFNYGELFNITKCNLCIYKAVFYHLCIYKVIFYRILDS